MIPSKISEFLDSLIPTKDRLLVIIISVTLLSVTPIGYHIISLNVPARVIQDAIALEFREQFHIDLSVGTLDVVWSFVVSCQSIGVLISFLLVVPLEKRFGTKRTLMFVNNVVLLGASISFLIITRTNVLFWMIIGRLLIGVYTGIACSLVPIFIQELAPKQIKGALCCFLHIAICAGSSLSAILSLNYILGGSSTWNIFLALPMLCALIQIAVGNYLYESPNFFLRQNNEPMAVESIRFYYSLHEAPDAEVLTEYDALIEKLAPQLSISEALSTGNAHLRHGIWLGCVVSSIQVFSGSMAAVSYSTSMFEAVSFAAWLTPVMPAIGSVLSIVMTLPAIRLVESCGRKRLLLSTLTICAMSNYLLTIFSLLSQFLGPEHVVWPSVSFAICFFFFGIGYNVGVGPIAYFIPGELVPTNAVSVAMGSAVAVNWLSTLITTLIFYPINDLIGGWSFLLFAIPTTFAIVYLRRELPEDQQVDLGYENQCPLDDQYLLPQHPVEDLSNVPERNQSPNHVYSTFT